MAIVTAGTLPLDVRTVSTAAWSSLTYTTRTASYAAADERSVDAAGTKLEFWGSGLSFDASGKLVGGKVFAYQESVGGQVTCRVDNLAVSTTTLMSWAKSGTALTNNLAGSDDLRGTAGADYLNGFAGNDSITGGAGNDTIIAGIGNDMINGGVGMDTAVLSLRKADYTLVSWHGTVGVVPKTAAARTADGIDQFTDIETIRFAASGETISAPAANFSPLAYIASYKDLSLLVGANPTAGFEHFLHYGAAEGRATTFSGAEYIASYHDLILAFGTNAEAGAQHFIRHGRAEGRHATFDGLEYIASYHDLITTLPADREAGALQYIQHGRAEGRYASFDGLLYIASHRDLISTLGANADAGAEQYIMHGHAEGRQVTFNAKQYLANYADLKAAFGSNIDAAATHFILHGVTEGRTDAPLI